MDKQNFETAFKKMRDASKPRKFKQSVDLTLNFKGINFKKSENRIDVTVNLPFKTGKESSKVALFAKDKSFISLAKDKVSKVILEAEIPKLNKKQVSKLVEEFDGFVAEGPVMLTVGKHLGQALAPKGKMPKPVANNLAALETAIKSISSGVRVTNKKGKYLPVVHVMIGKEEFPDEQLSTNAMAVYNAIVAKLPNSSINLKSVFVKTTMGPAIKVEAGGKR